MYLDDIDGFHYVVKTCLQWVKSHSSVFTTQDHNIVHLESIVKLGPATFVDYFIYISSGMFSINILQLPLKFGMKQSRLVF